MAKHYVALGGIVDTEGAVRTPGELLTDVLVGDAKLIERYIKAEAIREATPAEVTAGKGHDPNEGPTLEEQIKTKETEIEGLKAAIKTRDARLKLEAEARAKAEAAAKAKAEADARLKAGNKPNQPVV